MSIRLVLPIFVNLLCILSIHVKPNLDIDGIIFEYDHLHIPLNSITVEIHDHLLYRFLDPSPLLSAKSARQQWSLHSQTKLNEVQTRLSYTAKPLKIMNLEEFLQNVIDVEEGKLGAQNPSYSSPPSLLLGKFMSDEMLNKRTVEDIWKDILHNDQSICQKSILGETRLRDFLLRAGILGAGNQISDNEQPRSLVEHDSTFKAFRSRDQQFFETQFPIPSPSPALVDSQSVSGRKRGFSGEPTETTTERRKKRMIKNRESAAISRARKQAYTNQLEYEVFELREINCWLKKQQEVDRLLSSQNPPKFQLRRTSSTIF